MHSAPGDRMMITTRIAAFSAALAFTQLAHATEAAPAPPFTLDRNDYLHDGLDLRVGFGFGGVTDVVGTAADEDDEGDRNQITGMATVAEVSVGTTVARGLLLGAGLWATRIASSNYFHDEGADVPDVMRHPQSFVLVGPFGDWYFLRSHGLHAQVGLGFAMMTGYEWERGDTEHDNPAFGGGITAAFGYDTWVSENWRVGVLARMTSSVMAELEAGETWIHSMSTFPALALTAEYN